MAEAVGLAGRVLDDATFGDPKNEPAADPARAPFGWTWDRNLRSWRARKSMGRAGGKVKAPASDPRGTQNGPRSPERHNGVSDGDPAGADRGTSDRDPDPGWFAGDQATSADGAPPSGRRLSIADVPQEVQNDIAGFAGLVGAPLLAMLQQIDPYCGTMLANCYEGIVDAALPLMCRSEKIVKYFTGDKSDWLLWGKLAMAVRPFAQAVLQHHVFRSVDVVRDEHGQVHVMPRARGESEHGDHLQPPVQDYSAYAA